MIHQTFSSKSSQRIFSAWSVLTMAISCDGKVSFMNLNMLNHDHIPMSHVLLPFACRGHYNKHYKIFRTTVAKNFKLVIVVLLLKMLNHFEFHHFVQLPRIYLDPDDRCLRQGSCCFLHERIQRKPGKRKDNRNKLEV